jgi:hypothetical protein
MKKVATLVVLGLVSVAFLGGCCAKRCGTPCEPRCGGYEKITKEYGCK